jgi:RimJ/RimL family protein N-acetyltransferase
MAGQTFGPCSAIGIVSHSGGDVIGGVVYNNYRAQFRSIDISFAVTTPRCLTKSLIRGIMAFPFDQLGCQRITAITPKRNRPCRKFLEAFGFKREGVARRGFGNDDAVIYGLLKKEWEASKWMRDRPLQLARAA